MCLFTCVLKYTTQRWFQDCTWLCGAYVVTPSWFQLAALRAAIRLHSKLHWGAWYIRFYKILLYNKLKWNYSELHCTDMEMIQPVRVPATSFSGRVLRWWVRRVLKTWNLWQLCTDFSSVCGLKHVIVGLVVGTLKLEILMCRCLTPQRDKSNYDLWVPVGVKTLHRWQNVFIALKARGQSLSERLCV